jgi:hypothetical protein
MPFIVHHRHATIAATRLIVMARTVIAAVRKFQQRISQLPEIYLACCSAS